MTTKPSIEFLADILARKVASEFLQVLASSKKPLTDEEILKAVNLRLQEEGKIELRLEDAKKHFDFLGKKGLVKSAPPEAHDLTEFGKEVAHDLFPIES
jgi:hypothetical protein